MGLNKPKVLILGTFHMRNYEELNSKNRQDEIGEVVSKIIKFKPTKIAVEMVVDKNKELNEKYKQYISNNLNLEMNEIYQVGFRTASKLGHNQIYPIDWMGKADMGYGEVEKWLKDNQPELFNELFGGFYFPEFNNDKSVLDFYRELNEPSLINQLHKMYVNMARIGDFNNYIGMEWLSWWYKRNLIIFSNITRLMNSEEERILLLVGCSHSSIIAKFLEESETCEIVNPLSYLY